MPRRAGEPVLDASDIDQRWLSRHLGWRLHGYEPISLRSLSHSYSMGRVHEIKCGGNCAVFKGPPDYSDVGMVEGTGLIAREARSYQLLQARGPGAPRVAPELYWATIQPDGVGAFVLECVGTPHELHVDMAKGATHAEAIAAVETTAALHATTMFSR